ncbi:unnamed protein product [Ambrosiozyma monospora]|uniref:Unnamed protein product n=1 Tax=Ambrosiozyma monospora TaxID=43982 RepID=A0A9W6YRP9_AMBMO|nr:unnamed protein product [Ambrosiozyma monospora]
MTTKVTFRFEHAPFYDTEPMVYDSHDPDSPAHALHGNCHGLWINYDIDEYYCKQLGAGECQYSGFAHGAGICGIDEVDHLSEPNSGSLTNDDEINPHSTGLNTNTGSYSTHDKNSWDAIDSIDVVEIMEHLHLKDHRFCSELGCTVTVCDIEPAGYRLERLSMYNEDAFDTYMTSKNFKLGTKSKFRERLVKSRIQLENMLDTRPDWSEIRWINVDGLEKFSLRSILQKCGVDIGHLDTQLDISRLSPDDLTFISSGTSEDQLIFQLESLMTDTRYTFKKLPPRYYTLRSTIQSIFRNDNEKKEATKEINDGTQLPEISFPMLSDHLEEGAHVNSIQLGDRYNNQDVVFVRKDLGTFILLRQSNTVISFFEYSGERIEEDVAFCFTEALDENRTINTNISSFYQYLTLQFTKEFQFVLESYISNVSSLRTRFFTNLSETSSVMDLQKLNFLAEEIRDLQSYLSNAYSALQEINDILPKPSGKDIQEMETAQIEQFKLQLEDIDRLLQSIDGLVNVGFNKISAGSDRAMSMLAYISLVFLPLSFWTTYYGMNLQSLLREGAGVGEFWALSVPFTIVIMMLSFYKLVWGYSKNLSKSFRSE